MIPPAFISINAGEADRWIADYRGCNPVFACILSFTRTGLLPQVSAAGKTAEYRRYTAAADGNFLLASAPAAVQLPPLSAGVSPVVISRALLQALSIPIYLFSTGLPSALHAPHIALPVVQANSVETGRAMSVAQAEALFAAGQTWGQRIAPAGSYLILGECVVGGTTTAQAVLTALGYEVAGHMSSSHAAGNHAQKQLLVRQGLDAWARHGGKQACALCAAAAVGDPMQLVVAGMLLAASCRSGVLLAGGGQMLAVYALAKAIAQQRHLPWRSQQVMVGTTRWVIEDTSADTVAIAQQIQAAYLSGQIDFSQSPYMQLRAYERGFVKEGVGAGGCAIAANLYKGWQRSRIRHAVEAQLRYAF